MLVPAQYPVPSGIFSCMCYLSSFGPPNCSWETSDFFRLIQLALFWPISWLLTILCSLGKLCFEEWSGDVMITLHKTDALFTRCSEHSTRPLSQLLYLNQSLSGHFLLTTVTLNPWKHALHSVCRTYSYFFYTHRRDSLPKTNLSDYITCLRHP